MDLIFCRLTRLRPKAVNGYAPVGRGTSALQILIEHHFQWDDRVVGVTSDTAVEQIDLPTVQPIDLAYHNPGMIVGLELPINFFPSRLGGRERKRAKAVFFGAKSDTVMTTSVCLLELKATHILCEISETTKVIFFALNHRRRTT